MGGAREITGFMPECVLLSTVFVIYLHNCDFSIQCSHGSLVAGRLLPVHGCEVDGVSVVYLFVCLFVCFMLFALVFVGCYLVVWCKRFMFGVYQVAVSVVHVIVHFCFTLSVLLCVLLL